MTGSFHHHRPSPDLQNFPECDYDGHPDGHNGGLQFSEDEGLERDGGERYGIYVPFEARNGKGKGERDRVSISDPLDLSSVFAADRWPQAPGTVRTLLCSTLCGITPYSGRLPFPLFSLCREFPSSSDKCRPAHSQLNLFSLAFLCCNFTPDNPSPAKNFFLPLYKPSFNNKLDASLSTNNLFVL